ncbi:Trypsin [Popillia japonica]|uniref:Trypsin n=1 Tax=Popillia japonica TaxID=7064 RepID=A0AAW1KIC1_POPJA
MICCIKSLTCDPTQIGKSEQACKKFGPGIRREVSSLSYVQPGDYQHIVALGKEAFPEDNKITWGDCSGAIINEYYILTTAHCARGGKSRRKIVKIRAGTIDLSGEEDRVTPQDRDVAEIITHTEYNQSQYLHNIGLLRLAEPLKFTSYVQPACLHTKKDIPENLLAAGWGLILKDDTKNSDLLLKSNVTKVDVRRCRLNYKSKKYIYDSEFCAVTDFSICNIGGGTAAFLSNQEDSRVTVVGLMSYGPQCAVATPSSNKQNESKTIIGGSLEEDNNGFKVVTKKKRPMNSHLVMGTAKDSSLKGALQYNHFHIRGLDPQTSEFDVKDFLSQNRFLHAKCEKIQSKYPGSYSSFKVSILAENSDNFKNPELWYTKNKK